MRRFGFEMEDSLYADFYRLFPDHGMRTSILRRCTHRIVQQGKEKGTFQTAGRVEEIADQIYKEAKEDV